MNIEQTECPETSAYKLQTPGNYPKESIQQTTNYCWTGIVGQWKNKVIWVDLWNIFHLVTEFLFAYILYFINKYRLSINYVTLHCTTVGNLVAVACWCCVADCRLVLSHDRSCWVIRFTTILCPNVGRHFSTRSPFLTWLSRRGFGRRVWFTASHIVLVISFYLCYLLSLFLI